MHYRKLVLLHVNISSAGGHNFTVVLTEAFYTHEHASCLVASEMMSYSIAQTIQRMNLSWSNQAWINARAEYTQWMYHKGLYKLTGRIEKNILLFVDGNQLSTCAVYCQGYRMFGLQVNKCMCILNNTDADKNVSTVQDLPCKDNPIVRCASENNRNIVTIYETDKIPATLNELGECLTVRTNDTHVISYYPRRCDSISDVQIVMFNEFRAAVYNKTWIQAYEYAQEQLGSELPTVKDLKTKRLRKGEFWLYNFREAIYFDKGINSFNPLRFCVSGRTVNGKIELRPENCTKAMPAVCYYKHVSATDPVLIHSTTSVLISAISPVLSFNTTIVPGYIVYLVPSIIGASIIVLGVFFLCLTKYHQNTHITTSVTPSESHQTQPSSLQDQSNRIRDSDSRSQHEYTEIGPEISTMSNFATDVDGYLIPEHQHEEYAEAYSATDRTNIYINDLPMSSTESFNLYQHLKEQRQANTHQYTSIKIKKSKKQMQIPMFSQIRH